MGCYTVPTIAAILHYAKYRNTNSKHKKWLGHLFLGAAIFGMVDHLWNGELFLYSVSDVMLGFVITITIWAAWEVIVWKDKLTTIEETKA